MYKGCAMRSLLFCSATRRVNVWRTRPSRSPNPIGRPFQSALPDFPTRGMSSVYETVRLASPKDIRLVTNLSLGGDGVLKGDLVVVSLDSKPTYGALSYTWGDPVAETEDNFPAEPRPMFILLNGTETPVSRNLCDFLLGVAAKWMNHGDGLLLWIDALCINQTDVAEKSHQVAMMSEIYSCASSVIVWLGREDQYTANAIDFIERLSDAFVAHGNNHDVLLEKLKCGEVPNSETDWDALQHLFTRRWFLRAWIVQEVALAQELGVVLGQRACYWTSLCVAARVVASIRIGVAWHVVVLMEIRTWIEKGGLPLVLALYWGRYFEATEAIDHVFSLYGISHTKRLRQQEEKGHSDDLVMATTALPVDYSWSAVDAFTRTARHVVEVDGDLSLLLFPREATTPTLEGLPSWVPDFSKRYSWMDNVAIKGIKGSFPYEATGASGTVVHPSSDERVLTVSAQRTATIEEMIPLRNNVSGAINIELLVEFLANVDDMEIVGMDPVAGLARSLLYNHTGTAALKDEEIRAQFERWIQHTVLQRLAVDDSQEISLVDDVLAKNYCRVAEKHFTGGTSSRQQDAETKGMGDQEQGCGWDSDNGVGGMMSRLDDIGLFCTSTGHICSGEVDVRPGDSIWLVPGLYLPLVLRPVAYGRYRSVGRAYVHGMMRGEAFQAARLEVIELE